MIELGVLMMRPNHFEGVIDAVDLCAGLHIGGPGDRAILVDDRPHKSRNHSVDDRLEFVACHLEQAFNIAYRRSPGFAQGKSDGILMLLKSLLEGFEPPILP